MSILLPGVSSHFPVVIHVYQKNSQTSGRIPKKSKRLNFSGSSAHFFALVLRYNFPRFRKFSKIRIDFYDQMRFFHFFIQQFTLSLIAKWEFFILYCVFFKIQNCVLTFIPKWDFSSFFDSDHYLFYNLNGQKRSLKCNNSSMRSFSLHNVIVLIQCCVA